MKIIAVLLLFLGNFGFGQNLKSDSLYIFIGKKISVIEFDPNENSEKIVGKEFDAETGDSVNVVVKSWVMDQAFRCRYQVVKNLHNTLPEVIEFDAYDHYGRPDFEQYDEVILYLRRKKNGKFYHQKYTYNRIYMVNNELITAPNFLHDDEKLALDKLKSIRFNEDKKIKFWRRLDKGYYPKPYFVNDKKYTYPQRGFRIADWVKYWLENFKKN